MTKTVCKLRQPQRCRTAVACELIADHKKRPHLVPYPYEKLTNLGFSHFGPGDRYRILPGCWVTLYDTLQNTFVEFTILPGDKQ